MTRKIKKFFATHTESGLFFAIMNSRALSLCSTFLMHTSSDGGSVFQISARDQRIEVTLSAPKVLPKLMWSKERILVNIEIF